MAVAYVDRTGVSQWGVIAAEAGISVESHSQTWEDPKQMFYDNIGQETGFAHNINPKQTVTISGEITATSGLLAEAFGVGVTLSYGADETTNAQNDLFGVAATGDFYMDSPTIEQSRGGWKKFSCTYERWPLIQDS